MSVLPLPIILYQPLPMLPPLPLSLHPCPFCFLPLALAFQCLPSHLLLPLTLPPALAPARTPAPGGTAPTDSPSAPAAPAAPAAVP